MIISRHFLGSMSLPTIISLCSVFTSSHLVGYTLPKLQGQSSSPLSWQDGIAATSKRLQEFSSAQFSVLPISSSQLWKCISWWGNILNSSKFTENLAVQLLQQLWLQLLLSKWQRHMDGQLWFSSCLADHLLALGSSLALDPTLADRRLHQHLLIPANPPTLSLKLFCVP